MGEPVGDGIFEPAHYLLADWFERLGDLAAKDQQVARERLADRDVDAAPLPRLYLPADNVPDGVKRST